MYLSEKYCLFLHAKGLILNYVKTRKILYTESMFAL